MVQPRPQSRVKDLPGWMFVIEEERKRRLIRTLFFFVSKDKNHEEYFLVGNSVLSPDASRACANFINRATITMTVSIRTICLIDNLLLDNFTENHGQVT